VSVCFIKGVGIAAPGLAGWHASLDILRGAAPYVAIAETPYAPALLPPNERRRATASVRQAFRAAEDAVAVSGGEARAFASVFASSDADMAVLHRICAALAQTPRVISPTDFHNSVHNAASGYWSIAVQSMALTTTLSAHDASFAVGLLEAVALVDEQREVLLVAYDAMAPQPLLAKRPLAMSAAVALVLGAQAGPAPLGRIAVSASDAQESYCAHPSLENLRLANPALRALPLLELLAGRRAGAVSVRGTGELRVAVAFTP
jgi:Beta-ketoacyl synthase, N-terminal domain